MTLHQQSVLDEQRAFIENFTDRLQAYQAKVTDDASDNVWLEVENALLALTDKYNF